MDESLEALVTTTTIPVIKQQVSKLRFNERDIEANVFLQSYDY